VLVLAENLHTVWNEAR